MMLDVKKSNPVKAFYQMSGYNKWLVGALVLFALNKSPLFSDPSIALKRLIVIAMPASMGAITVDSFDKE